MTRWFVRVAAVAFAGCAMAAVTINPGNGVSTNVTERFTGEMDLTVNSGSSGGGIVRLNTLNSYSGTTTLGCGTLVAGAMSATGHVSSVGADGLIKVGPRRDAFDDRAHQPQGELLERRRDERRHGDGHRYVEQRKRRRELLRVERRQAVGQAFRDLQGND